MNYTNAQILSAVLNKWIQPVVQQFAGMRLASMPLFAGIENKIRSTGWVRPTWSLAAELAPFMQEMTGTMVEPLLSQYLSKVPDGAIPAAAHAIVDKAIANGGLSLFDGNVTFEEKDLQELKKLLDYNLPLKGDDKYKVKTEQEPGFEPVEQ